MMAKRNPSLFFMLTWTPYLLTSLGLTEALARTDLESVLFALVCASSLAGLLTLVHEVELASDREGKGATPVAHAAA